MKLLGKCLFIFAALLILQGTVFASGAEPEQSTPNVTISIMDMGHAGIAPWGLDGNNEGRWKIRAGEEFGIDFDVWDFAGDENARREKLNLLFATGEYPEVLFYRERYYNEWAKQGVYERKQRL